MPRSSEIAQAARGARALLDRARRGAAVRNDPRTIVRIVLGTLLVLNLAAAVVAFKPFGGSPEDLERQRADLQRQVILRQAGLTRAKALAAKMELARAQGEDFLSQYVLNRRTASVAIISELNSMARQAGIKPKGEAFGFEAIDGSETLSMMTVAAGYEGPYPSLTRFINALDRSPRFLIVESLQASPQQGGAVLTAAIKFNAFVRDDVGRALAKAVNRAPQPAPEQPQPAAEPVAGPPASVPAAAAPVSAEKPAPAHPVVPPAAPPREQVSAVPAPPPPPAQGSSQEGQDGNRRRSPRNAWSGPQGVPLPFTPSITPSIPPPVGGRAQ
jgi:hypothetical protein